MLVNAQSFFNTGEGFDNFEIDIGQSEEPIMIEQGKDDKEVRRQQIMKEIEAQKKIIARLMQEIGKKD